MKVETYRWPYRRHVRIVETIGYDIICLLKSIVRFVFLLKSKRKRRRKKLANRKEAYRVENAIR